MTRDRRYSLSFDDWPEADRALWRAALAEGDILDGAGPCADWAETTRNNARKAWGYWLAWLATNDRLDETLDPLDRITPDLIATYVESLRVRVSSRTVFAYILDLYRYVKRVAPTRDWSWLTIIKNRLQAQVRPAKDKGPKIRPSQELFDLGMQLMESADGCRCRYNPLAAQVRFRDGLLIALLAARPIRLKNLTGLEIGCHLVRLDTLYGLRIEAEEVKNRKHIEVTLPESLAPRVDLYLSTHRPKLLGGRVSDRLWISRFGSPLSAREIHHQVRRRTLEAFGTAISPHLFRDCAATSIAIEDPEHVRIAAAILGHHSLATTQKHYDQSRMLVAGRMYHSALAEISDAARRESRGPYKFIRRSSNEEA